MWPKSAKHAPDTNPTYPDPIIATRIDTHLVSPNPEAEPCLHRLRRSGNSNLPNPESFQLSREKSSPSLMIGPADTPTQPCCRENAKGKSFRLETTRTCPEIPWHRWTAQHGSTPRFPLFWHRSCKPIIDPGRSGGDLTLKCEGGRQVPSGSADISG